MRKAILILSVMALCGAALSCDKAQSPFDKSSIERTERELDMYRFALQARETWVVEYFPDEDLSYGGWVYVMQFREKNEVQMWFEGSTFVGEDPVTVSEYSVEQGSGPMLKFRTHNDYLHWFTFPGGPAGSDYNAFEGDFEFKIMSVSPEYDKIVLRGNRTGNTIVMSPLPQEYTPESYIETVRNDQIALTPLNMKLVINGNTIGSLTRTNTTVTGSFEKYAASKVGTLKYGNVTEQVSAICLPGRVLKFYAPYVFKEDTLPHLMGQTMQTFKWQLGELSPLDCFVCTDSFMEIKIEQ